MRRVMRGHAATSQPLPRVAGHCGALPCQACAAEMPIHLDVVWEKEEHDALLHGGQATWPLPARGSEPDATRCGRTARVCRMYENSGARGVKRSHGRAGSSAEDAAQRHSGVRHDTASHPWKSTGGSAAPRGRGRAGGWSRRGHSVVTNVVALAGISRTVRTTGYTRHAWSEALRVTAHHQPSWPSPEFESPSRLHQGKLLTREGANRRVSDRESGRRTARPHPWSGQPVAFTGSLARRRARRRADPRPNRGRGSR